MFLLKLRKNLEETVQSFKVTNDEMKDAVESPELQECNSLCQVRPMATAYRQRTESFGLSNTKVHVFVSLTSSSSVPRICR